MSPDNSPSPADSVPEVNALAVVARALQPLAAEARQRVVDSVLILLGSKPTGPARGSDAETPPRMETRSADFPGSVVDIRLLKEQKKPKSANEMAALVAYYLAEVVGGSERKESVEIAEIEKYFKQAQFRLPANPKMTLVNAKNAGYFDAGEPENGDGEREARGYFDAVGGGRYVVEGKVGGFVRSVYTGSSASVHASRDKKEVLSILRFVETALAELLELETG